MTEREYARPHREHLGIHPRFVKVLGMRAETVKGIWASVLPQRLERVELRGPVEGLGRVVAW